ncbi:MAG: hypothetical protein FWG87_07005 [Defluviitaleaceae bacterium]|nr:hypothetical protein [Defluviitaleaceae bacterium]
MVGALKAVLIAIISTVVLFLIMQLAFFFPFYLTIVVEAFNLSNIAANDNYVKEMYYDHSLDGLRSRAVFNKLPDEIMIEIVATDASGNTWEAVGDDDERTYSHQDGPYVNGTRKPYLQRGSPVTVTITAVYPIEMTLWGRTITHPFPVSFSMTSIGLKYYKDLEWDGYP